MTEENLLDATDGGAHGSDWDGWRKFVAQARQATAEGNYSFAEVLWMAAVDEAEVLNTDLRLPVSLDGLAEAFWNQGKLRQAENVARRSFQLYGELVPGDHLDLGVAANNLAMIYHWQQKYGQAEPLYKRSLEIKTRHLGANHPDVVTVLSHYAKLLQDTYREEEADHLRVCIDGVTTGKWGHTGHTNLFPQPGQASTGPAPAQVNPQQAPFATQPQFPARSIAPPAVATSSNTSKPDPAAEGSGVFEIALAKAQPKPPDHLPSEIESLRKKVADYEDIIERQNREIQQLKAQNQPEAARRGRLDIDATDRGLGPEMTWDKAMQAARRAFDDRSWDEAHTLLQEAMRLASEMTEADPRFATTLDALGECLFKQEKYGQAEMMWQRSLNTRKQHLGAFHKEVAQSANNLARLHYHLSRFQEAEFLANKCIEIYNTVCGANSVEVASSTHNVATLYHVQGKYELAENAYKKALDIRLEILGTNHPDTAVTMRSYANLLTGIGRSREAEGLDEKATGMITGGWKSIDIDPDSQLGR